MSIPPDPPPRPSTLKAEAKPVVSRWIGCQVIVYVEQLREFVGASTSANLEVFWDEDMKQLRVDWSERYGDE